jgi:hypothetical protein
VIIVRVLLPAILLQALRALVGRALTARSRKVNSLQDRHARLAVSSAPGFAENHWGAADRALLVEVEFASRPMAQLRPVALVSEGHQTGEVRSSIESKDGPGGWERSDFPRDRPRLTLIWVEEVFKVYAHTGNATTKKPVGRR